MIGKLVLENLRHRPMRSLLSILLIGVPVTLILCLVGVSQGLIEDTRKRSAGVGADILIRPKGSSYLTLSGAPLPEQTVAYFAKKPHVKVATGIVNMAVEGVTLGAAGVDLDQFNAISGGLRYIAGGPFKGPKDVIVDDYVANQKKLKIGGILKFQNTDWRVSGIMENGKLSHVIVPLETLQEVTGNPHKISQIYVKLDDPRLTDQVVAAFKEDPLLEGYPIFSLQEYMSLWTVDNVPGLRPFINVIMGIGVIIGFAVVCLSMYMAVLQRTREIGILKSMGGSKGFILQTILAESVVLGLGGTAVGILMSYGAWWLIHTFVPASLPMAIVYEWWPIAGAITLVGTSLGALYPGLTAASHDPIEALAYE